MRGFLTPQTVGKTDSEGKAPQGLESTVNWCATAKTCSAVGFTEEVEAVKSAAAE